MAIWIAIIFVLGEISVRLFVNLPLIYDDEKTSCFQYDASYGWWPIEENFCVHSTKFDTHIYHNKDGFRDKNHDFSKRQKTIAFIGDSFVWGYEVAREERFTERVQLFLPDWRILNMGISGFGTDQEYMVMQEFFPEYKPDLVVLTVHSNDSIDNSTNCRDLYYKPYFELENGKLVQKGNPAPKAFNYTAHQYPILFKSKFIQALFMLYDYLTQPETFEVPNLTEELLLEARAYCEEQGAGLILLFTYQSDEKEMQFLDQNEFNYLHLPTNKKFKDYGQHWTPEGHEYIANQTLEYLLKNAFVAMDDVEKGPEL